MKSTTKLYLINELNTEMYKVGITNNPKQRLKYLQTNNPHELIISNLYDVNTNQIHVERSIHRYFQSRHIRGEWFELPKTDVNRIPYLIERFIKQTPKDSRPQISSGKHQPFHEPMKNVVEKYDQLVKEYKNNPNRPKKNPYGSLRNMVAHKIGMSSGTLGRILIIRNKDPKLLDDINKGILLVSEAYEITKYINNEN